MTLHERWLSDVFITLRPRQYGRHIQTTFSNALPSFKNCISIQTSLKFVLNAPINYTSTLVQVMDWRRSGDKPSAELTLSADAYMHQASMCYTTVSYDWYPSQYMCRFDNIDNRSVVVPRTRNCTMRTISSTLYDTCYISTMTLITW